MPNPSDFIKTEYTEVLEESTKTIKDFLTKKKSKNRESNNLASTIFITSPHGMGKTVLVNNIFNNLTERRKHKKEQADNSKTWINYLKLRKRPFIKEKRILKHDAIALSNQNIKDFFHSKNLIRNSAPINIKILIVSFLLPILASFVLASILNWDTLNTAAKWALVILSIIIFLFLIFSLLYMSGLTKICFKKLNDKIHKPKIIIIENLDRFSWKQTYDILNYSFVLKKHFFIFTFDFNLLNEKYNTTFKPLQSIIKTVSLKEYKEDEESTDTKNATENYRGKLLGKFEDFKLRNTHYFLNDLLEKYCGQRYDLENYFENVKKIIINKILQESIMTEQEKELLSKYWQTQKINFRNLIRASRDIKIYHNTIKQANLSIDVFFILRYYFYLSPPEYAALMKLKQAESKQKYRRSDEISQNQANWKKFLQIGSGFENIAWFEQIKHIYLNLGGKVMCEWYFVENYHQKQNYLAKILKNELISTKSFNLKLRDNYRKLDLWLGYNLIFKPEINWDFPELLSIMDNFHLIGTDDGKLFPSDNNYAQDLMKWINIELKNNGHPTIEKLWSKVSISNMPRMSVLLLSWQVLLILFPNINLHKRKRSNLGMMETSFTPAFLWKLKRSKLYFEKILKKRFSTNNGEVFDNKQQKYFVYQNHDMFLVDTVQHEKEKFFKKIYNTLEQSIQLWKSSDYESFKSYFSNPLLSSDSKINYIITSEMENKNMVTGNKFNMQISLLLLLHNKEIIKKNFHTLYNEAWLNNTKQIDKKSLDISIACAFFDNENEFTQYYQKNAKNGQEWHYYGGASPIAQPSSRQYWIRTIVDNEDQALKYYQEFKNWEKQINIFTGNESDWRIPY